MKNHYFLIQIGHMIAQFLEAGFRRITALAKIPDCQLFENVKEAFRTILLTDADQESVRLLMQHRLR